MGDVDLPRMSCMLSSPNTVLRAASAEAPSLSTGEEVLIGTALYRTVGMYSTVERTKKSIRDDGRSIR